ncbi:MAG TPA: TusE/DsrC/DsvC family sulfur relay protein [Chromatiaceae bacterium]|jgi:tRNA 2-thiouridine synthesizing protein E|nr:TusE/DsrC/DsvC family sulfur relay protein [Chromatiaceae bacterium]HIN82577.1 TusE/DsrC/DsvC family sulfur relay protein [Chromatiales bacterium]HIA08252.1 TusE/DsrC/DsvC family sulfur relay protein [Chromatiaceae bacterium]HIB83890.1 TusE/DsrC/DsvC family sulfur relay protein [Chromatiaceae bacterium]HIO13716.1 TusE/DsrC/DsvC family sulfur relay protein [Chromatiales bacterium]
MTDILKHIMNSDVSAADPNGNLIGMDDWSEVIATGIAADEGLELTDEHMEVVLFLRDYYRANGGDDPARELSAVLDEQFMPKGGSRYLYTLFPGGPVRQGSRIAGLPAPDHVTDASFGTVQ